MNEESNKQLETEACPGFILGGAVLVGTNLLSKISTKALKKQHI